MFTEPTSFVHQGCYTDFEQPFGKQSRWLWKDLGATIASNVLGILITIALARLLQIIVRLYRIITQTTSANPNEPTTLDGAAWDAVLEAIGAIPRHQLFNINPGLTNTWQEVTVYASKSIILFLLFAACLAAGVVAALLNEGGTGLSQHPDCGVYFVNTTDRISLRNISVPYENAAQVESESFAKASSSENQDGAIDTRLIRGNIPTVIQKNVSCPFASDLCYGKGVVPIEISSGPVPASAIGIHTPLNVEFQRRTVCSPLNMNSTFIKLLDQTNDTHTYGYYYGRSIAYGGPSMKTTRIDGDRDHPTYNVMPLYSWGDSSILAEWIPIDGLMPEAGSTTTLLIITTDKINYLRQSSDPIFPANDITTFPHDPRRYWINQGPGTVLGCLDYTEWRVPSRTKTWLPFTDSILSDSADTPTKAAVGVLQSSLIGSIIYNTVQYRLAAALEAQSRITGYISLPLANEQWKVEAAHLFRNSLARIFINAKDIARGTKAKYWGYVRHPDSDMFCKDTYKLTVVGWTSVNRTGYSWILAMALLCIVLAIPLEDCLLFECIPGYVTLLIAKLRKISKIVGQGFERVGKGFKKSLSHLKHCLGR